MESSHNTPGLQLGTQPSQILAPVRIKTWDDISFLAQYLPGWVFRGQSDARWGLQPSLERARHEFGWSQSLHEAERFILGRLEKRLKEELFQGADAIPRDDDWIAWLSIIQHFGGPTRLLDFTRSIEVATYFAYEQISKDTTPAIWAVNAILLPRLLESQLQTPLGVPYQDSVQGGFVFNRLFDASLEGYAVGVVEPIRPNVRQKRQRGLFLTALNIAYTFEENLYGMFDLSAKQMSRLNGLGGSYNSYKAPGVLDILRHTPVIKMVLNRERRDEILNQLAQLGITRFELFPNPYGLPSLDGLAGVMKHELLCPNQARTI